MTMPSPADNPIRLISDTNLALFIQFFSFCHKVLIRSHNLPECWGWLFLNFEFLNKSISLDFILVVSLAQKRSSDNDIA